MSYNIKFQYKPTIIIIFSLKVPIFLNFIDQI